MYKKIYKKECFFLRTIWKSARILVSYCTIVKTMSGKKNGNRYEK